MGSCWADPRQRGTGGSAAGVVPRRAVSAAAAGRTSEWLGARCVRRDTAADRTCGVPRQNMSRRAMRGWSSRCGDQVDQAGVLASWPPASAGQRPKISKSGCLCCGLVSDRFASHWSGRLFREPPRKAPRNCPTIMTRAGVRQPRYLF